MSIQAYLFFPLTFPIDEKAQTKLAVNIPVSIPQLHIVKLNSLCATISLFLSTPQSSKTSSEKISLFNLHNIRKNKLHTLKPFLSLFRFLRYLDLWRVSYASIESTLTLTFPFPFFVTTYHNLSN